MAEEMKKYLFSLLAKVDGLHCVVISDRDGCPILKVVKDSVPESAVRPSFLSTFSMANDQASKVGLGKNKTLVAIYSKYQVVHMKKVDVLVTFIAKHDSNTGLILTLDAHIDPLLPDLGKIIATAENQKPK